jgi:transposase/vacuolar-type H+-ATPase subunit H
MGNGLEIQVLELQNQNQILQIARQEAEEIILKSQREIDQTKQQLLQSEEAAKQLEEKNKFLQFQYDQLRRMMFGAKRERFIANIDVNQLTLPFDVPEQPVLEQPTETIEYTRKKTNSRENHHGRLELPSHLPVEEIHLEPEQDTTGLKCIGQEITSELDFTPAKLFVRKYIRNVYSLSNGEGIIVANLPARPIDKGIAGPGLLSNILVEKFVDHLPIYRQIERFKRDKVAISSSTIDGWVTKTAALLTPLYDHLVKLILAQGYLQVDETPIKVLDHQNKKGKTHQGYHWVYNAPMQNAIFFDYCHSRGREGPMRLLKDFKGYLQTDGYGVYEWFARQSGITHIACMAHARRKFEQALDYDQEKAGPIMEKIQELYAIERQAREAGLSTGQRKELRLDRSLPIMNELGKLMTEMNKTAVPKSPMGIALNYASQRWDNLLNYLYDGSLEIDNNWVENAIRPCTLGRKNYLFAGSHEGAQRAAMFYSFFGTCKKNNVNPYLWLKKVLEIIPEYPANKIGDLLPQNLIL